MRYRRKPLYSMSTWPNNKVMTAALTRSDEKTVPYRFESVTELLRTSCGGRIFQHVGADSWQSIVHGIRRYVISENISG